LIDPDGAQRRRDGQSETGEISVSAPSEANFDETVSIAETRSFNKLAPTLRKQ